jgi:hypothetical protein
LPFGALLLRNEIISFQDKEILKTHNFSKKNGTRKTEDLVFSHLPEASHFFPCTITCVRALGGGAKYVRGGRSHEEVKQTRPVMLIDIESAE